MIVSYIVICISLVFIRCSTYTEGDSAAAVAFQKMTVQEKTMYDAVEKEWYEKELMAIREAVGRRDIAPRENSTPFIDIANVIKTNNNITLTIEDKNNWNTYHKNRAIKCRWDRLDEDWYRKLLLTLGVKEYELQELIPIKEEVVEDKPLTQKEKDLEYIGNGLKEINEYLDEHPEVIEDNVKNIIPQSKYDDIFYEIRKCDEAIVTYHQMIETRLLTWDDYYTLVKLSTKCKAIQIGEKLSEWKN